MDGRIRRLAQRLRDPVRARCTHPTALWVPRPTQRRRESRPNGRRRCSAGARHILYGPPIAVGATLLRLDADCSILRAGKSSAPSPQRAGMARRDPSGGFPGERAGGAASAFWNRRYDARCTSFVKAWNPPDPTACALPPFHEQWRLIQTSARLMSPGRNRPRSRGIEPKPRESRRSPQPAVTAFQSWTARVSRPSALSCAATGGHRAGARNRRAIRSRGLGRCSAVWLRQPGRRRYSEAAESLKKALEVDPGNT